MPHPELSADSTNRISSAPSDERLARVAAIANSAAYDEDQTASYIDGAPHIKHASIRRLFEKLLLDVYDAAAKRARPPRVLDLGAGEGSVTYQFLNIGAKVVSIDISSSQLESMTRKCSQFTDRLEIRCQDIDEFFSQTSEKFDIIAANSFLHHVPDYMSLIGKCAARLNRHGIFFSFQDPLRYDTVKLPSRLFTDLGYLIWRLKRGPLRDVVQGIGRRIRRRRGIYLDDCSADNAEYHVVRNGIDQNAIESYFREHGFNCTIVRYYSAHNSLFQPVGNAIGIKNTFAVIAQRKELQLDRASDGRKDKLHSLPVPLG